LVKVGLPIPNAIAADFYVRDATPLAAPLRESFDRKPGYFSYLNGCEQLRRSD
jgi:hypothetical protein